MQYNAVYTVYIYIIDLEDVRTQIPPLAFLYFKKKWAKIFWICLYDNFGWKFSSINAGNGQKPHKAYFFPHTGEGTWRSTAISKKTSQPARGKVTNPRSFQRGTKPPPGRPPIFRFHWWVIEPQLSNIEPSRHVSLITAPETTFEKKTTRSVYTIHIYGYDQICMYT